MTDQTGGGLGKGAGEIDQIKYQVMVQELAQTLTLKSRLR